MRRLRLDQGDRLKIAILAVDPSRRKTGGALLGDRIRMNAIHGDKVFMRSLATRASGAEIAACLPEAIAACRAAGFDLVIVETSGIGQGDAAIVKLVDCSLYVMTPEFGAASQLEKIDMLDFADFVAINKFDRRGAEDALRDVRKQMQRNRETFAQGPEQMPVYGTIASRFNDDGVTALYQGVAEKLKEKGLQLGAGKLPVVKGKLSSKVQVVLPAGRARYLAEIADTVRGYHLHSASQARIARERQQLAAAREMLGKAAPQEIDVLAEQKNAALDGHSRKLLQDWPKTVAAYSGDEYVVKVRGKEIRTRLTTTSLSGTQVRKVALPRYEDHGEILKWQLRENVPGEFPVHLGRVLLQARERGSDAHVRGRGRSVPHQPALPPAVEGPAGEAPVDRLRLGDAVRLRSGRAARHLRQGRQLGRLHRHAGGHESPLLGLRPVRPGHQRVDDHQRPGADDPRDVFQYRHRSAGGEIQS